MAKALYEEDANEEHSEISDEGPGMLWQLTRRKSVVVGLALIILIVGMTLLGPYLVSTNPNSMVTEDRLTAPGIDYFFGTDNFGRDIFSRVIHGGKISLLVGLGVVIVSVIIGGLIGLFAGYYRFLDNILMRIMDGFMAFPGLVLAIAMLGVLGPGIFTVIIAMSTRQVPNIARVVRGSVLVIREYPLIEAEKSLGAKDLYILFYHILPNCLSPIIIQSTMVFSFSVLGEATLSFLGIGVPPTSPSWGNILSESRNYLELSWWMAFFPGMAIVLTVLGLNLFGDGLRDVLDPKMKNI